MCIRDRSKTEEENTRGKAIEAEERANSARYVEKAQGIKKVDVISAASKAEQERHSTMAAKLRYEIDAAGKESLNAAENLRSDASRRSALRLKLADKIESIIRESVKPMANINELRLLMLMDYLDLVVTQMAQVVEPQKVLAPRMEQEVET